MPLALSCARPSPPDLAPLSALRVGGDPADEARAAAEGFVARGRTVHRELDEGVGVTGLVDRQAHPNGLAVLVVDVESRGPDVGDVV